MIIYNCTSSTVNPVTWSDFRSVVLKNMVHQPFNTLLWYPGGDMHESRFVHYINVYLWHLLPAHALDILLFVLGKKPL